MRLATLLGIYLAVLILEISAQEVSERTKRAGEVRDAVEKAAARGGDVRVKGVRYDLRLFEGKLIGFDQHSFTITSKKGIAKIPYKDVVELDVKGAFLSFFPNPTQKPFAEWAAVRNLAHGDSIDIDIIGKKQEFGVLLKTTDTDLTILQGNKTVVFTREKIARVLLARRDTPRAKRILKGAGKGAAAGGKGGGGSGSGAAIVAVAIMTVGAAAGAVHAAGKRWPNDRLLIYAR